MSTAINIIQRALFLNGCSSELKPATQELIQICFEDLINFIYELDSINIELGLTVPTSLTDDIGEPSDTTKMFQSVLSVRTAPFFQKEAPRATKKLAKRQWSQLLTIYAPHPLPEWPDVLPVGAGNERGTRPRVYMPTPDALTDGDNNPLAGTP